MFGLSCLWKVDYRQPNVVRNNLNPCVTPANVVHASQSSTEHLLPLDYLFVWFFLIPTCVFDKLLKYNFFRKSEPYQNTKCVLFCMPKLLLTIVKKRGVSINPWLCPKYVCEFDYLHLPSENVLWAA